MGYLWHKNKAIGIGLCKLIGKAFIGLEQRERLNKEGVNIAMYEYVGM
jgi:hypothetical protein